MDPSDLRESVQKTLDIARLKEIVLETKNTVNERYSTRHACYIRDDQHSEMIKILQKYPDSVFYVIPEEYYHKGNESRKEGIYLVNYRLYTEDEFKQIVSKATDLSLLCVSRENIEHPSRYEKDIRFDHNYGTGGGNTIIGMSGYNYEVCMVHPLYLKMDFYLSGKIDSIDKPLTHEMIDNIFN